MLVKRPCFKAHAECAARAQKELRSSFITPSSTRGTTRTRRSQVGRLRHAAHSSAQARGPAYDKERAERLSAAAVQVATDFAAGFK